MLKSLFVYGILGVLLIPAKCDTISVCLEPDKALRVDCTTEAEKIKAYEFSWKSLNKVSVINTNASGASAEERFKDKSNVEELKSGHYRMILSNFIEKLPRNTTFICKLSEKPASVTVEREQLPTCSAVSVFLKSSCSWIVCLLFFFYQTHS